jgi:phospholipid-binding lipoprotein MlaA
LLRVGTVLEEAALDKYSFTRDAYLQRRRATIVEGRDSDGEEPRQDGDGAPGPADDSRRRAPAGTQPGLPSAQ